MEVWQDGAVASAPAYFSSGVVTSPCPRTIPPISRVSQGTTDSGGLFPHLLGEEAGLVILKKIAFIEIMLPTYNVSFPIPALQRPPSSRSPRPLAAGGGPWPSWDRERLPGAVMDFSVLISPHNLT